MKTNLIVFTVLLIAAFLVCHPLRLCAQDYKHYDEFVTNYSKRLLQEIKTADKLKQELIKNPTPENLKKYNEAAKNIKQMKTELPKIQKAINDANIANSFWDQCKKAVNDTYVEPLSSMFIASHDELFGANWQSINSMYDKIRQKQQELIKRKQELLARPHTQAELDKLQADINELKEKYESLRIMTRLEQRSLPASTFFWTTDNPMTRRFAAMFENFDYVGYTTNFVFNNYKRWFDIAKPYFYSMIGESYPNLTHRIADSIVLPALTAGSSNLGTALENTADAGTVKMSELLSDYALKAAEKNKEISLKLMKENQEFILQQTLKNSLKEVPVENLPRVPVNIMADTAEAELRKQIFDNKKLNQEIAEELQKKHERIMLQLTKNAQQASDDSWLKLIGKGASHANKAGYVVDFGQDFVFFLCTYPEVKSALLNADKMAEKIRLKYRQMVSDGKIDKYEITEDECVNMVWFKEGTCFPDEKKKDDDNKQDDQPKPDETDPDDKSIQKPDDGKTYDTSTKQPDDTVFKKPDDGKTYDTSTKQPDDTVFKKPDDGKTYDTSTKQPDDNVFKKPDDQSPSSKSGSEDDILKSLLEEKAKLLKEAREISKKYEERTLKTGQMEKDLLTEWDLWNTEGYTGLSPEQNKMTDEQLKQSLPKVYEARQKARHYRECLNNFRKGDGNGQQRGEDFGKVNEIISRVSEPDKEFKNRFPNITGPYSMQVFLQKKRAELEDIKSRTNLLAVNFPPGCTPSKVTPTTPPDNKDDSLTPQSGQQPDPDEDISATISGLSSQEIFGTSKNISLSLNAKNKSNDITIVWNSSPNLIFNPEKGSASNTQTTVTFDRMSNPTRIWAEITIPGKKTIESNQLEIEVVSPKYELIFEPPANQAKLKQPVKVTIKATPPPVQDKLVDYRWVEPADRKELSNGVIEIVPVNTKPINLHAIARVPGVGDTVNDDIKGQFSAATLEVTVKVLKAKYDIPTKIWDPKQGHVVETKQFAIHQDILVQATVTDFEKDKIFYLWSVNEDSHIVTGLRSDIVTVNRSQTGTCIAHVTVSDKDGNKLGEGEVSFEVPISQEDMDNAVDQDNAKLAKEKLLEAKKDYNNGHIDGAIEKAQEATSLDPKNTEAESFLNRVQSEKNTYMTKANTARDNIKQDNLEAALTELSAIPHNFQQYPPIKEVFDLYNQAKLNKANTRNQLPQEQSVAIGLANECKYDEAISMTESIIERDPYKGSSMEYTDAKIWLDQFKKNKATMEDLIEKTKSSIAQGDYKSAYQTAFTANSINKNCPGVAEMLAIAEKNKNQPAPVQQTTNNIVPIAPDPGQVSTVPIVPLAPINQQPVVPIVPMASDNTLYMPPSNSYYTNQQMNPALLQQYLLSQQQNTNRPPVNPNDFDTIKTMISQNQQQYNENRGTTNYNPNPDPNMSSTFSTSLTGQSGTSMTQHIQQLSQQTATSQPHTQSQSNQSNCPPSNIPIGDGVPENDRTNGIDDDNDGVIDEGPASGTCQIAIHDTGGDKDDQWELTVDGSSIGRNNQGKTRFWDLNLNKGQHTVSATGVDIPDNTGTYTLWFGRCASTSGPPLTGQNLNQGTTFTWTINVP